MFAFATISITAVDSTWLQAEASPADLDLGRDAGKLDEPLGLAVQLAGTLVDPSHQPFADVSSRETVLHGAFQLRRGLHGLSSTLFPATHACARHIVEHST